MAWIESHQELREHPKTKRLCRLLELPRPMVVGYLHFLWWWAYDYAPEGDLSSFTDDDIADAIDWPGSPEKLVSALVDSGFLNADRKLHDWGDFAQKWIERRRADRERKRAATRRDATPVRGSSEGVPPEIHSHSGVTGPDRTIPDLTGPDHQPKSFPDGKDLAAGAADNGRGRERPSGVPSDVVAALSGLPNDLDARAFHDLARETLEGLGFTCRNEIPVANRGDGRPGRYDLRAERDGQAIAFEFDDRTPRKYSGIKLASVEDAARVIVLRCPFEGPLPSVPNIDMILGAGRALVPSRNGQYRNGRAATAVMEPPSADDEALWALAVEQIANDDSGPTWRSNVDNFVRPLAVVGRGPTGGLQLRAPPYAKQRAQGMRQMIVMALRDLGDPQAAHVAIVE